MRSDIWQFLILLLSLCVLLYFICQIPDANRAIADIKIEIVNDKFGLSRLCYFLFIIGSGYLIGPTLFVSLLSARSSRAAANGALLAAPCLAATAALITILGIGCGALAQTGTAASNVLANVLNNNIPSWAKILTSLGLYSAIISSADSCLMTAAAVCANDIFRRPDPFFARVAMLAITVGALLLATQGQSILALLLMAYDIFVCGIVAPVFVGILFPGNAKKSRGWFFAAMICGSPLGFASAFSGNYLFSMAGLMIALFLSFFGVYTRKRGIYSSS